MAKGETEQKLSAAEASESVCIQKVLNLSQYYAETVQSDYIYIFKIKQTYKGKE